MPVPITVETTVVAPVDRVWRAYTTPAAITRWNAASDDWHTTTATVDLRPGGAFSSRMEAKDGSAGFDFAGTYTDILEHERIAYTFGGRAAEVAFQPAPGGAGGTTVRVSFDPEETHAVEQQRQGWQAILDSFRRYVEGPGMRRYGRRDAPVVLHPTGGQVGASTARPSLAHSAANYRDGTLEMVWNPYAHMRGGIPRPRRAAGG
jgi:uncharacterized protein YndB with AHSA1/START domain